MGSREPQRAMAREKINWVVTRGLIQIKVCRGGGNHFQDLEFATMRGFGTRGDEQPHFAHVVRELKRRPRHSNPRRSGDRPRLARSPDPPDPRCGVVAGHGGQELVRSAASSRSVMSALPNMFWPEEMPPAACIPSHGSTSTQTTMRCAVSPSAASNAAPG